jgi:uncharacterized coiled-coil DUF342 family protein
MSLLIDSYLRKAERRQESHVLIKMIKRSIESLEKIAKGTGLGVDEVEEAIGAIADMEEMARKSFTSYFAQKSDPSESRMQRELRDKCGSTE